MKKQINKTNARRELRKVEKTTKRGKGEEKKRNRKVNQWFFARHLVILLCIPMVLWFIILFKLGFKFIFQHLQIYVFDVQHNGNLQQYKPQDITKIEFNSILLFFLLIFRFDYFSGRLGQHNALFCIVSCRKE